jgi:hypothetical protein
VTITRRSIPVALLLLAAASVSVAGCTTEYHGHDSGIDGVLWRQMASFEDPLSTTIWNPLDETIAIRHTLAPDLYPPAMDDPREYLAGIDAPRWDGAQLSLPQFELERGGVILYDAVATDSTATFSLFIASGPRSNAPTDQGGVYSGPSEVYTCYSLEVRFASDVPPHLVRTAFTECPPELVDLLADDAAFASAEVFDG